MSDHDMFAFMVDTDHVIVDPLTNNPLNRGFFVENSETGASCVAVTAFFFDRVCGNHIIWGATGVIEMRLRHIGDVHDRIWPQVEQVFRKHLASGEGETRRLLHEAQGTRYTDTLDNAAEDLVALARRVKVPEIGIRRAEAVIEMAQKRENRYGDPRTVWSAVGCITEMSQGAWADDRNKLDRAAGKLLSIVK